MLESPNTGILIATAATINAASCNDRNGKNIGRPMSPTARTETVLVIDDEGFVRSLAHSMLTRYGYNVITANSGEEALRFLETCPNVEVNLALVDLVMPGLNGVQTVESIHKLRPGLPVLYISA